MASFKSILGNLRSINLEKLHVKNELQFSEDNYTVRHILDPATGKYEVFNGSGVKYLSMNHDGTQNASVLKNYTDAVNNTVISHASLINNHASTLADHDDLLVAHDDRLLAVEGGLDPMTYVNAVTFGTTYTLATVPIASNKRGFLSGKVYFQNGFIEFLVYCRNISGTVSIHSWNLDYYYIDNSTSMQFDVSTTNIVIKLTGLSSVISARLAYDTDFMTA
jgi:hypothetical protein